MAPADFQALAGEFFIIEAANRDEAMRMRETARIFLKSDAAVFLSTRTRP